MGKIEELAGELLKEGNIEIRIVLKEEPNEEIAEKVKPFGVSEFTVDKGEMRIVARRSELTYS